EIVAGVAGAQQVAELLAVAGCAARIDAQHCQAPGREYLRTQTELDAAHASRVVLYVDQQRIAARGVEVGGADYPALHAVAGRFKSDRLARADLSAGKPLVGRGERRRRFGDVDREG